MSSLLFALFTIEVSSADSVYLRFLELFFRTTKVFFPHRQKNWEQTHTWWSACSDQTRKEFPPVGASHQLFSWITYPHRRLSLLRSPPSCCRKTCFAVQKATVRKERVGAWIAVVAAAAVVEGVQSCRYSLTGARRPLEQEYSLKLPQEHRHRRG